MIVLVRHAPTADNRSGTVMGRRDVAPEADGLAQAAALLQGERFATAACSDTLRARRTAVAIAPDARLIADPRLRERSFGEWEGRDKAALELAHPESFTASGAIRLDADIPGGEPLTALLDRVHAALSDLRAVPAPVLLVAHNGTLRAALVLLGLTDLDEAAGMSLPHLDPVRADLAALRRPDGALT